MGSTDGSTSHTGSQKVKVRGQGTFNKSGALTEDLAVAVDGGWVGEEFLSAEKRIDQLHLEGERRICRGLNDP